MAGFGRGGSASPTPGEKSMGVSITSNLQTDHELSYDQVSTVRYHLAMRARTTQCLIWQVLKPGVTTRVGLFSHLLMSCLQGRPTSRPWGEQYKAMHLYFQSGRMMYQFLGNFSLCRSLPITQFFSFLPLSLSP